MRFPVPTHNPTPRKLVLQISDTHIVADGLLNGVVDTLNNLRQVMAQIDEAGRLPDVIVFSGDLADSGEPEAYRRFRATVEPWIARMGVPVVYLPGNHDLRPAFRAVLLDWEPSEEPIDQVVWSGGLRIVTLDSTIPGKAHGELRPAQLTWLAAQLAHAAPLGTLLVLHHPPIPGPNPVLNEITFHEPATLADVVAGTDVRMVLAGHAHHTSAGILGGVPVWVSSATAYQMDVPVAGANKAIRGMRGSAFTWIDVFDTYAVASNVPFIPTDRLLYDTPAEVVRRSLGLEAPPA